MNEYTYIYAYIYISMQLHYNHGQQDYTTVDYKQLMGFVEIFNFYRYFLF